jgi:hypothetical protein
MEDILKKYKYLVVNGCSQTFGQNCDFEETWPVKLANKLGLKLINLASPGAGWYHVENTTTSFINYNKEIVKDCFFILQKSMLDRRLNYEELPMCRTDIWEQWNIKFISRVALGALGYIDWDKYDVEKPDWWLNGGQTNGAWKDVEDINAKLFTFPEHRHYPNSRNTWKLGENSDIYPPYIKEQFEELMLYWGSKLSSFHLFLKTQNIDHIVVDGYSPFLSHKLNFKNYYDDSDEFEFIKRFWSKESMENDEDEIMLYDFKNIKSSWIYDLIDKKYKIDDVIIWSLYQYKVENEEYNVDGGHAGPLGMDRIYDMIYLNLIQKGWFK